MHIQLQRAPTDTLPRDLLLVNMDTAILLRDMGSRLDRSLRPMVVMANLLQATDSLPTGTALLRDTGNQAFLLRDTGNPNKSMGSHRVRIMVIWHHLPWTMGLPQESWVEAGTEVSIFHHRINSVLPRVASTQIHLDNNLVYTAQSSTFSWKPFVVVAMRSIEARLVWWKREEVVILRK